MSISRQLLSTRAKSNLQHKCIGTICYVHVCTIIIEHNKVEILDPLLLYFTYQAVPRV